ncbi:hypothetical protein Nit79A3_3288 [Nitrosomonas sp. Is79A3]|uniref:zf-HC2 domain-containing protein n=1 Tax=Nitrosomonas sp. (strain Is79A3) TaxID=261292 RepID=UPI000215D061
MALTDIKITSKSEHQEVWNLLPWYVNHTLEPAEQYFVRKHVKTCVTCRIEINQQQQLLEKIQQPDLLQQVSQVSFAQLKKRVREQSRLTGSAEQAKPEGEQKNFSHQFPSFVKYTALAASLLLLAMPFMLNPPTNHPELKGDYRTLASLAEGEHKNNIIRIVFAEHSGTEQIKVILNGVSGHIIKGPSKNGIYEVQIGNRQANSLEVNDAITQLRKNSLVVFAEPSHELLSSD